MSTKIILLCFCFLSLPTFASQLLKVALIDTGIDLNNPTLKSYVSPESQDFTNSPLGIQDEHGHGTHIASLIIERSGLSPRDLQIVVLKYFSKEAPAQSNLTNTIKAFRYSQSLGVKVINYSAGGTQVCLEEQNVLKKIEEKNILVIAAAGNESVNSDQQPFFPASYPFKNILSVGAHDSQFIKIDSSNFGANNVHISTFGKDILGSLPGNIKKTLTGTSQATAIVTGLVLKVLKLRPDLSNPELIKEQILKSAEFKESLKNKNLSAGTINIQRTLAIRSKRTPALFEATLFNEESF